MTSHDDRPASRRLPAQRGARSDVPQALMTVPETMLVLRLSRAAIYDLIRSRQLTSVKIGRSRRVPVTAVNDYVARLIEEMP
jgi:excisionase family DNA binding protein